ncbi:MAG: 3'-5' exonuclease, partial [Bacillota bacterium]
VHGLSDARLAREGVPARQAFEEFTRFVAGAVVVGHNVGFDRRMIAAHARRVGVALEFGRVADTYEMARRFVGGDDLTLEGLCERFGVVAGTGHRAADDAEATGELLARLLPLVERDGAVRRAVVQEARKAFEPLAGEIEALRGVVTVLRPPALLDEVLRRSGLGPYYEREPKRAANLDELRRIFAEKDRLFAGGEDVAKAGGGATQGSGGQLPSPDPLSSLEDLLNFAAMAKNVDRLSPDNGRVRVLTVHQAKGLEFDVVVVAGLSEHEFPSYPSIREGREIEERRLFYVALTRARRRLLLTGHGMHDGKVRKPSPYLVWLARYLKEERSGVIRGTAANM